MKVSVIIPAYNIEKYIARCLTSLTKQTLKDIEIIVVNDGSTDNTLNVIREISSKDKRIKIIDKQNQGSIEARKSGMQIANGEYLLFVDGDDWLELDTIEKLYNNSKFNKSDIVLYNGYFSFDNHKKKLNTFKSEINENSIKDLLLDNICAGLAFKMIKHEYIKLNNITFVNNISYAEDLATSISLFLFNPKISYVDEYLYNYYQREDSITKIVTDKTLEVDVALKFIYTKLKEHDMYEIYKEEYEYMVYNHIMEYQLLEKYYKYRNLGKKLQQQYKEYNININRNKYISHRISKYSLSQKIRTKAYCKSYDLGQIYDTVINIKKG